MFEEAFDFLRFKPRKSRTKQMRHEDTIARRAQEILTDICLFCIKVEGNDDGKEDGDDDFPHAPPSGVPSGSFLGLPLRPSSPSRGYSSQYVSDTFGGQDVGMSGMAAPPSSDNDVVIGGKTAASPAPLAPSDVPLSITIYPDNWLMDEGSQQNPYFNCFSCNFARPSDCRYDIYHVCTFCHHNMPDVSRERWCMGCGCRRPELSFFKANTNEDMSQCGGCGRFDSISR
jgi:hypothetical protein